MALSLVLLLALAADATPPPTTPSTTDDAAASTTSAGAARGRRVAVTTLGVDGVDDRVARVFSSSLIYELRKLERTSVLGLDEIKALLDLEAERQLLGCSGENSCLAEIADALGADVVVLGSLARVGDTHVVSLKSVLQGEVAALGTYNRVVPAGDGEELLAEIGPAVAVLFPGTTLRAGQVRGVSPELARRLSPPPLAPPLTIGVGVLGGGLLLGAGVAGIVQQLTYGRYVDLANDSRTTLTSGALLKETGERALLAEQTAWALLAAGAGVALVTAVMVPFTDFDNLRDLDNAASIP
jgi:hypothetical protein